MDSALFVIDSENRLTELRRSSYASEALLQELLAKHPRLLSGSAGEDGRLLLVRREFGAPEDAGAGDRWSLDHLFLDANGVPVLVEVKRASDTRARREVVAQMLDYAANGVACWPIEKIVEGFTANCLADGVADPDEALLAFLGERSPDAFWRQVDTNLRAGRVRMVFVADQIGKELRRIVEFLNEQMRPAEVIAIEVEQFVGENGLRTLVPRVVGNTERAQSGKTVGPVQTPVSIEDWFAGLNEKKGAAAAEGGRKMMEYLVENGFDIGVTSSGDSIYARLTRPDGKSSWPFFLRRSTGRVETALQYLKNDPAFEDEQSRSDLLARLKALPGVQISTVKTTGFPSILLADLLRAEVWAPFAELVLDVRTRITRG